MSNILGMNSDEEEEEMNTEKGLFSLPAFNSHDMNLWNDQCKVGQPSEYPACQKL